MKVAVFSAKEYDKEFFTKANEDFAHELDFFEPHLTEVTAKLAFGYEAVCVFVNDQLDTDVLKELSQNGVKFIALRCAGFNNVDLEAAHSYGLQVARVPAYSPHGVAEHAVALMLCLNRKIYRSHNRVREGNFSLEGLMGFEFYGKTVGIIGTGKIGTIVARIMMGFGSQVLAYDPFPNPDCERMGVRYLVLREVYSQSDVISLHIPLMRETYHLIDKDSIENMKKGVMLINTSRGGLIDTAAVIKGLKSGKIGHLGLDVYEEEGDLFFEDLSNTVIQDDTFSRLLTFPNVIITGHQAFFTNTALKSIADTTLMNITDFANGELKKENAVTLKHYKKSV